jgi:pimeloyl-ACP methyl ester carboxylesterase
MTFDEKRIKVNGVEINYVEADSEGKPLLLLHGVSSEWQSFLPLFPILMREHHVFAMDLRGHGGSGRVRDAYHLADYARDVTAFLEEMTTEPAVLYGHSLGAQIGMAVAAQEPGRIRGLVLGDPPYYFHNLKTKDSVWYEPFVEMHQLLSKRLSAQELDEYMTVTYPKMDVQKRKARALTLSRVDPDPIATIMEERLFEGYDTDDLPRQIRCPVLLIQGNAELGSALREEDARYLSERIPRCEVLRMTDVGHGLPVGESIVGLEAFLSVV